MVAIYGVPMTHGATPAIAADAWLEVHGQALGTADLDLRLERNHPLGQDNAILFEYRQFLDELPVESCSAILLVLNGVSPRVVYVGAR